MQAGDSGVSGPETPAWAGDSGQAPGLLDHRGRPEIPVQRAGDSGQAGDSGHSPGMLQAPIHYRTTKKQRAEKNLEAGDSGSFGLKTPVDRRLRTISGVLPDPSPVAHHSKSFGSEKRGTGDSGPEGRRLRCDRRLRTISGLDPNSEIRTP